ncbi:tetratricopeptide repeat protein [Paenibacillus sacheonensis]|uniref:Tetratricopeptide repeat protein n=1 Tax=Paenibacillus sacheonensis TaxID=742054 RepID=A0A7X5C231_9BACL|nr:tetratricopeptide repeat protein [Paenibacillus sacheonensis]MBM7567013.1 tetratricopeptide (TPR) repeat protein [Paenibacillus sacheonensis]NBC73412.1 tetratricopeptide repeat protein [Paenibacillus sacheonensis]
MKEKKIALASRSTKIIPIQWDATFFFERAVRSMDRYHYDKALKYFRRAAEYEPENPVNHCNMAGILSEMGNYEESNRILLSIVDELDPEMTECHFYMANNFANMEMYEAAEDSLVRYLEEDAEGQFLDEAEEMMELLHFELERPTKLAFIKAREGFFEHDQARAMLEEGKFVEAVRLLESIVEKNGEFLAARNNLALAYYYMGIFDKALATIKQVLELEPGNLHALSNLAIFYQHAEDKEKLAPLVQMLCKTVPFHQEHVFKLATTMGILGEHGEAYRHFMRLLKDGALKSDPCLYHYAAVAACNMGRYDEARRLWQQVKKMDADSHVPGYYLEQLDRMENGQHAAPASYHYHLPFEEQFKLWEKSTESLPDHMKRDPLVRSSFFWALRHGDRHTKLQVIQALGMIADNEVKDALRDFIIEPQEDDYLKRIAIFVLRSIGVHESLRAILEGKETVIEHSRMPSRLPIWEDKWQSVLESALAHMNKHYDLVQQHDLLTLWIEFLSRVYPDVPKLGKVEGWAAALEYLTAKMHRREISYHEVSQRYGISIATVSKCAKRIDEICGIKEKMRMTFPALSEHRE